MADDTLPLLYVASSTVLHAHRHADASQEGARLTAVCSPSSLAEAPVEGVVSVLLLDWLADSGARVCARCQSRSSVARGHARRIELRRAARKARATALSEGAPEPSQLLLEV